MSVLSGQHGPKEPGPEISLVSSTLHGWAPKSSRYPGAVQGEWDRLDWGPGSGKSSSPRLL